MPNLHALTTSCVYLELRPLPSTGITRLPRYYGPLRHPKAPGTSLTSFRLVIPDHAMGLPVLRALSLCACCRHYPGTATGGLALLIRSVVSTFPERVVGSACASTFSRLTQRSFALRPAHSCCHQNFVARYIEGFSHFVTSMTAPITFRLEHFAGWGLHPLESAAFARRTPDTVVQLAGRICLVSGVLQTLKKTLHRVYGNMGYPVPMVNDLIPRSCAFATQALAQRGAAHLRSAAQDPRFDCVRRP